MQWSGTYIRRDTPSMDVSSSVRLGVVESNSCTRLDGENVNGASVCAEEDDDSKCTRRSCCYCRSSVCSKYGVSRGGFLLATVWFVVLLENVATSLMGPLFPLEVKLHRVVLCCCCCCLVYCCCCCCCCCCYFRQIG